MFEPREVLHLVPEVGPDIKPRLSELPEDFGFCVDVRRKAEAGAVLNDGLAGDVQVDLAVPGLVHTELCMDVEDEIPEKKNEKKKKKKKSECVATW